MRFCGFARRNDEFDIECRTNAVSQKFVLLAEGRLKRSEFPKSRSFDSAEVRFAQDDSSVFDMNLRDRMIRVEVMIYNFDP